MNCVACVLVVCPVTQSLSERLANNAGTIVTIELCTVGGDGGGDDGDDAVADYGE
jgi:hypothetical protein